MTGILKVDQWKDSGDNALMTSDGAGITMSSSNFPCTALCGDLSSGSTTALISQTTTSVRIRTISNDTGVGLQDPVRVAVVIFGELA
jgi:hypothetical protein